MFGYQFPVLCFNVVYLQCWLFWSVFGLEMSSSPVNSAWLVLDMPFSELPERCSRARKAMPLMMTLR